MNYSDALNVKKWNTAMLRFSLLHLTAMTLSLITLGVPYAQERSVGALPEKEISWGSLSSLVDSAAAQSNDVNNRISKIILCNKKLKIFVPGDATADSDGCIVNQATEQLSARMTKAAADITAINNKLTLLDAKTDTNVLRIDGNIAGLNSRMDSLVTRVTVAENDLRGLNTSLANLNNQLAPLNSQLDGIYNNLVGRTDSEFQLINSRISSEIGRLDGRVTDTYNAITNVNNRMTNEINALNSRIAAVNAQINDLYNRTNDLYNRTNDLYNQMGSVRYCGSNGMVYNQGGGCQMPAGGGGLSQCTLIAIPGQGGCPNNAGFFDGASFTCFQVSCS